MKISLTVNGKRYRGTYTHESGLPELTLGKYFWRGSSLGPANRDCKPDEADREYWRELNKGKEEHGN